MLGMPYIWTGHNAVLGWSHTNTAADSTDLYLETFDSTEDPLKYKVGSEYRKATEWTDEVVVNNKGERTVRSFTFRKTHRGPVVGMRDGKYLAVKAASMEVGPKLFAQKWAMAKSKNLGDFKKALSQRRLTGSNTIYADKDGNIFYLHGNAMPKRNPKFDWSKAVDGADPETEWTGYHQLDELPQVLNPSSGFLQNCNSTPFLTSGSDNPERSRHPAYMAPDPDTLRAQRSRQILSQTEKFTFESWAAASMDTHLLLAEMLVPDLTRIAGSMQPKENAQTFLEPLMELSKWNFKSSIESTQTTVFMTYFEQLQRANQQRNRSAETNLTGPARTLPEQLMSLDDNVKFEAFKKAVSELNDSFGTWKVKWGEVNRLQRIHTSGSVEKFNDAEPSVPIAGANGQTGCILTFGTRREDGQKKRYGISGNSYLAVVEFGPRVKRRSLLVFGQDADPSSPNHFDQAEHYSKKEYKPAWFDLSEIKANSKQNYKPGYKK